TRHRLRAGQGAQGLLLRAALIVEQALLDACPGASRTWDFAREPLGPGRAAGTLRLFARLAQAFHEHASIELLGRVLVVGATGETDAIDFVQVRLRKPVDVVELEPARLAASPAVLGDNSASAFVPHVHLAFDRSR